MRRIKYALRSGAALAALIAAGAARAEPADQQQRIEEAEAKIEALTRQVEELKDALAAVKASQAKVVPSWKGAPQLEDKDAGWTFKPRGRIQYDAGFVENPQDDILTRNLGFNNRVRRFRLGAEGTIPGGFGYKAEVDLAGGSVGFGDVILTYQPKGKPWSLTIGNHETLNGLEQISSSRYISFLERAAFNDAFINTRRLGISAGYVNPANTFRVNAGLFSAHSIDSSLDNDGWIGAARAVYSPLVDGNQLHFGVNLQHREFQSNNGSTVAASSGQPSTNQLARYRARPFSQLTDVRFVDTQSFAARSDTIVGFEFAGIFKSLHLTAEAQYLTAQAYDAGDRIAAGDPLDLFPAAAQFVPDGNPSFWGGYIEAGYFLTGETRGYKNGLWDRTKVLKPFSKGGWGALQINGRVDYLDLASSRLKRGCTNNFTTGLCAGPAQLQKGGEQLGLLASLVWIPEDYVRFYLQGAHARITGGPLAGTVISGTTEPVDERTYTSNSVQARAQIDF